jgi:hypothetical protein
LLDLIRLRGKAEVDWDHTDLCTFLQNAFAVMAIGLGISLALHVEFEKLIEN